MRKRIFSILLALCMVLCLVLTAAFAEGKAEETPVCTCETACTAEAVNAECAVCGAEGALVENCGKYAAEESGQAGASDDAPVITAADVQALIYALPEAETIGADNAADVEAQLEAIDEAKIQLSDEDFAVLDFTRYDAAAAALMVLSGEPSAAFTPQTANDHSHCYCGGSVTAGDHTSHSDVTYTAWDGTSSITYTNNTAYVYLTGNATLSGHLTVDGKTLYLCLNGKTLASNGTAKIQVKNGGRLVLCDCRGGGTFKGATQSVWGGACIYLYTSTLDMFGGKLTGGKVTGKGGGGAIALDDQQCIFNMYGGEISGNNGKNYGGAIFRKFNANMPNTTGGAFNMYGGTIKNNTAKNGGAFFSTTGGTINMTGGTISGNTATMNSNNAGGGAIYMRGNGKINISGSAQITGNSSSLDGGAILMGWGEINISGSAKINSNTASRWGGAICLRQDSNQSTTLYMRGGEISDNRASKEGGAVHVLDKDCQFFLYDGKITGNTSGDGGAIYLNQEPSWLIMQGGEISGNTATGNGGGVYIYRSGSVCQLYSGKIENNKASGNGGGIYINPSNSGQLRVGNKPLVQNNTVSGKANNVYLPSGKTLTIEIGMSKGASIGVTTANIRYPVAFSNNYKKDYANYFFADDVNAHVEYKDDQKLYLVSGAAARPLTVTFDPNGGMLAEADKTKSLTTGEPYGTLPVPSYAGYDFAGWYTEQDGGIEIKEDTTVTVFGTQTLYAHWTPVHVHAYTQQVQKPEALKTPADCTNNAVYYLSCACGEVSINDADTFTAANTALDHDWGAWMPDGEGTHKRVCTHDASHVETAGCTYGDWSTNQDSHWKTCIVCGGEADRLNHADPDCNHFCDTCGIRMTEHDFTGEIAITALQYKEANCLSPALYYKSCKICMLSSKGTASEATFASGEKNPDRHAEEPGDWQHDADSHWRAYTCCHLEVDRGAHQGGTADCLAPALCEVCQHPYGELGPHHFVDQVNEYRLKSAATCTSPAVYYQSCSTCGAQGTETFTNGEPLGHDYGAWTSNGDGTHTRVCAHDAAHTETENCHGGTATCTAKAVCTVCGGEYGEMAAHSFTAEKAEAQYLKSAATCTEKAAYYKSCAVCGLSSEGTADEATFFSGNALDHDWGAWTQNSDEKTHTRVCAHDAAHTETENCHGGTATCTAKAVCEVCKAEYGEKLPHDFTAETVDAKYLKSAATCTAQAEYYKSCAVCGLSSEGTADEATFFSGNALDHDWGAWTSNEDGTHTRTCTVDGCSAGTQTENCIDANKDHKCDICDYIISECADDNKDHKCDYCGKKLTEHTGGKATCKDKAKCEVCGAEYGELDPKNHTNLKHFPAKAATKTTEGNIEYWYCEGCGKYFSDKDGTKEIKKADTVTAKLKDDSKSPQTGDTCSSALWIALLLVSGGAAIGTMIVSRKKKYNR